MIIYNVTCIVEEQSHEAWLSWMLADHIPKVMGTKLFTTYRLLKVLDSPNEGVTYCVQYTANNLADLEQYKSVHSPQFQEEMRLKFENKCLSFRTVMDVIAQ